MRHNRSYPMTLKDEYCALIEVGSVLSTIIRDWRRAHAEKDWHTWSRIASGIHYAAMTTENMETLHELSFLHSIATMHSI
ncbi:MAG: hypothetical protein ACMUIP_16960, partial [bacterium]